MLEMYEKTGYEHLIDFNWEEVHTDIYYIYPDLLELLDVSEDKFEVWSKFFPIRPIINIDGSNIYPKSWLKPLQRIKDTEIEIGGFTEKNYYTYNFHLEGWSNDEIIPRVKQLLKIFEVNLNDVDSKKIWKVYKTFIKEKITDPLYEHAMEYIYASKDEDYFSWRLVRQTCTYNHLPEAEEHLQHLAYVHFAIDLKYELTDEFKNQSFSEGFTSIFSDKDWSKFVQKMESHPLFKIFMEKKPIKCEISMEPQ